MKKKARDRWVSVSLFVIDESHNLRTYSGKRFQAISNWISENEDADTLLLTATPINNSIDDITNQILLGSRGEQDLVKVNVRTSEGVVKSKSFFDALQDIKKKIAQNRAAGNDMRQIYEEARQVIDPVLREFVIRNTRQGIMQELDGKPLIINDKEYFFPNTKVKNIKYRSMQFNSLKTNLVEKMIENASTKLLLDCTDFLEHPIRQLTKLNPSQDNSSKSITYKLYLYILALSFIPYRSMMYEKNFYGKSIDDIKGLKNKKTTLNQQLGIYGLIRTNFLKRYESSSKSLLISIKRYKENLNKFKYLYENEEILVNLGELNLIQNSDELGQEELDVSDKETLKEIIAKGQKINKNNFNVAKLSQDIISENKILDSIIEILEKIEDKKLKKFKDHVASIDKNKYKKLIVFSFYSDTIDYLEDQLSNTSFFGENVAFVSGKNKKEAIKKADLFSPIARDFQIKSGDEQIDCLFSTDVLSEGQNLQDCGYLINYDLHWNPVRMIQRNGRINRLGSIFEEISVINIVPEKDLEEVIGLIDKLETKIDLIQTTIGNDSSILGEKIKHIDFKGIYDSNEINSNEAYKNLEKESDVFSDDEFIGDLKTFINNKDQDKIDVIKAFHFKNGEL
jgi:ERCC4-related helicase